MKAANTALRDLFGSDDVQNPARLMRVAGTVNYPSDKKRNERGYVTELTTLHDRPTARGYEADELIALVPQTNGYDFNNARPQRDKPHGEDLATARATTS